MVEINWDDKTTRNLYPPNIPYKANLFKKKGKDLEIDKKIDQQKRAEIKIETPSNLEAILSHPFNREKLKPGDHFVSSHFTLGDNKRGVITNMFIKNNILYATLRVLNAKSGPGVSKPVELPVPYINKDTSSVAAKARERISKDQQRQQAIEHGSGGLKVGDKVFVSSGQNSGKNGRIVSLKMSRGVISATVAPSEGQEFTTKLSNLVAVLSVSS
jgi:transcription antitermination factor NusG